MTCIIIEDQPPAQRILKKYIEDIGTLHLKATFSDAIQAIEFLKTQTVALVFLDIHLPKISGIDFLKTMNNQPNVILTTAFAEYALESYEFDVVDYLLKPFSFQRFVKAVSKIPPTFEPKLSLAPKSIFIKSGYEHIKVNIEDIIYIKSDTDYSIIFLENKKHLSNEPLRYWLKQLDPNQYVRIHRSYIINTHKIQKIAGNQVFLTEEIIIPIGRAFKENFINRFVQ